MFKPSLQLVNQYLHIFGLWRDPVEINWSVVFFKYTNWSLCLIRSFANRTISGKVNFSRIVLQISAIAHLNSSCTSMKENGKCLSRFNSSLFRPTGKTNPKNAIYRCEWRNLPVLTGRFAWALLLPEMCWKRSRSLGALPLSPVQELPSGHGRSQEMDSCYC